MTHPAKLASDVRLLRQSGHPQQSKRLLEVGEAQFPGDPILIRERNILRSEQDRPFKRCRVGLTSFIDKIGTPGVILMSVLLAYLLSPILFVPAL